MKKHFGLLGMLLLTFACISCSPAVACTIFTVSIGETVLFGNSEDYFLPNTSIWFVPARGNGHGYCYVGFDENNDEADGYPQGGMNDRGLCFDANGLPPTVLAAHPERNSYPYNYNGFAFVVERHSSVEEVIDFYQTHGWSVNVTISWQEHWADATGDAVVVSAGMDGDWAFTRKENMTYLVSTNWNRANPENGWYPCQRYQTAAARLSTIIQEEHLTVEAVRDILDAVHQEGQYATQYSNIFDPVNRDIYLYYYHNFHRVIKLNLDEELAKGPHKYKIAELFKDEDQVSASHAESSTRSASSSSRSVPSSGFGLIIAVTSLALAGKAALKRRYC